MRKESRSLALKMGPVRVREGNRHAQLIQRSLFEQVTPWRQSDLKLMGGFENYVTIKSYPSL